MKKFFLFAAAAIAALSVNASDGVDKSWCFTAMFPSSPSFTKHAGPEAGGDALVAGELYAFGKPDSEGKTDGKAWVMDFAAAKYFNDFLLASDRNADKKLARLKSGGAGGVKEGVYYGAIAFRVAGPSFIQVAAISSSSNAVDVRKLALMTEGGEIVASQLIDGSLGQPTEETKTDPEPQPKDDPIEFEYEGGETTLFLISAEQATKIDKGSMTDDEYKQAKFDADGYVAGGVNYYKIAATNVMPWKTPTGLEELSFGPKAVKTIENGQLVIIRNGVKFNALGATLVK